MISDRRGKSKIQIWRLLVFLSACLMMLVILTGSYVLTDHEKVFLDNFFLESAVEGVQIELCMWENPDEGKYYLFLPAWYREKNIDLTIRYGGNGYKLFFDDVLYRNEDIWEAVRGEKIYQMRVENWLGVQCFNKPIQVLISDNLPSLFIKAEAEKFLGEEFANKKYAEIGELLLTDRQGNVICTQELERFKIRGNLTSTFEKRPYSFTLSEPEGLCGLEAAKNWKLLANATDGSYVRNKLVFDLANGITKEYEPDGEFIELYLNGKYQGLYLLTEGVEIAPNRLEADLREDWILEMELDFRVEEDIPYVITNQGQLFVINTKNVISEEDLNFLVNFLNDIESALYSENSVSEISGRRLEELIDMDSWVDAWLIQEIAGDHDTGIASQFSYIQDGDGRLHAGPVWDFDGTMGNVNTAMFRIPEALTTSIRNIRLEENANQNRWLSAMYQNEEFAELLQKRYAEIVSPALERICSETIDEYVDIIRRAAVLDALRWNENRLNWAFVLPETFREKENDDYHKYDTLSEQLEMVRDFLQRKKSFLDKVWVENREYCIVEVRNEAPFLNPDYNHTLYYWVEKGESFSAVPVEIDYEYQYEFLGYSEVGSNQEIKGDMPIERNYILKSIWREKALD